MRQEYVTFLSPGAFVSEETSRPVATWDIAAAVKLAKSITERHGASPFGFYFSILLTADPVPDGECGKLEVVPKQLSRSGMYFLGGKLLTLDALRERSDPRDRILISNMECNGWPVVVENVNSWKVTQPFTEDDVIVNAAGRVTHRGDEPELVEYRKRKIADQKAELDRLYPRPA